MSRPQELFTSDHAAANATRLSGHYPETGETSEKPLIFALPPLIDDDPLFDHVWDPLRATFDIGFGFPYALIGQSSPRRERTF